MSEVSDLVAISKLEVNVYADRIEQTRRERGRVQSVEAWRRVKRLGKGGFGEVHLERCSTNREFRAVKQMVKSVDAREIRYRRELEAAALFSQPKYTGVFVEFLGWYETTDHVFLTMEYLPLGDLAGFMNHRFPETETRSIVQQILVALEFMHERNFIHRDLKPANILVDQAGPSWWIKIADFGISKRALPGGDDLRTRSFSDFCVAPEVLVDKDPYTRAVDIWATGVIAYCLLTAEKRLFELHELVQYRVKLGEFPRERLLKYTFEGAVCDFVAILLSSRPDARPSATQCLQHEWVSAEHTTSRSPSPERAMHEPETRDDTAEMFARWTTEDEKAGETRRSDRPPVEKINTASDTIPAQRLKETFHHNDEFSPASPAELPSEPVSDPRHASHAVDAAIAGIDFARPVPADAHMAYTSTDGTREQLRNRAIEARRKKEVKIEELRATLKAGIPMLNDYMKRHEKVMKNAREEEEELARRLKGDPAGEATSAIDDRKVTTTVLQTHAETRLLPAQKPSVTDGFSAKPPLPRPYAQLRTHSLATSPPLYTGGSMPYQHKMPEVYRGLPFHYSPQYGGTPTYGRGPSPAPAVKSSTPSPSMDPDLQKVRKMLRDQPGNDQEAGKKKNGDAQDANLENIREMLRAQASKRNHRNQAKNASRASGTEEHRKAVASDSGNDQQRTESKASQQVSPAAASQAAVKMRHKRGDNEPLSDSSAAGDDSGMVSGPSSRTSVRKIFSQSGSDVPLSIARPNAGNEENAASNIPAVKLKTTGIDYDVPAIPGRTPSGGKILHFARAKWSYEAAIPEELSFSRGEVFVVTKHWDDGWWTAEVCGQNSRRGMVPSNYFRIC